MGADETFVDPFEEVVPPETDDPDVPTEYNTGNNISINSSHRLLIMRLPINASSKPSSPKESWQSFQQFFEGDSDEKILTALETLLEMRKEGDVVTPFDDLLEELEEQEIEAVETGTSVNAAVFESSGESEEREDSDLDSINLYSKTFVDTLTTYPPSEELIALSTATRYVSEEVEGRHPYSTTGDPSTLPPKSNATTAVTTSLLTTANRSTRVSTEHKIEETSPPKTAQTETTEPLVTSPTYVTESERTFVTFADFSSSDNTETNPQDSSPTEIPPKQSFLPTTEKPNLKKESPVEMTIPSVESSTQINKKTSFWNFVTVDERLNANGRTEVDETDGSGSDSTVDVERTISTESMKTESLEPIIATSTTKPQPSLATIKDNQNGYSAYDFFDMYDDHAEFSTLSSTPTIFKTRPETATATTTTTKKSTTTPTPTSTTNSNPSWLANPQSTRHPLETNSDVTAPKNHSSWNGENEVTFDNTRSSSRGFKIMYGEFNRRNAMSFAISSDSSSSSERASSSAPLLSSAPPLSSASYSSSTPSSTLLSSYLSSAPTSSPSSNSKRKQRKSRKHKKIKRRKKARRKQRDRVKQKLSPKLSFKNFLLGSTKLPHWHNSALDEKPKTPLSTPSYGSIPSSIAANPRQSSTYQLLTARSQEVTSPVTSSPATGTLPTNTVTAAQPIPHDRTALTNYVTNVRDPYASSKSTETTTFPTRKSWRSWTRPVLYHSYASKSSLDTTSSTAAYSRTATYRGWMMPSQVPSFNVILGGDATRPPTLSQPAIPSISQPGFVAARGKPVEFAVPRNVQENNPYSLFYLSKSRTSFRQSLIEIPSRQKKRERTLQIGEGASETDSGPRKQGFASNNNLEQWLVKVPGSF